MRRVADHLEEVAVRSSTDDDLNYFGRSSYNRYYYSCYWAVRVSLNRFFKNWEKTGHADVPRKLRSSFKKLLLDRSEELRSNGVMSDAEYNRNQAAIKGLIKGIADILQQGYDSRCIADYNPERKVVRDGVGLRLEGLKTSEFKKWDKLIHTRVNKLDKILNDLGL